jgi:hypothetical protein
MVKDKHPSEALSKYQFRYTPMIKSTMSRLNKLISQKGWPSDRMCGIDQADVLHELNQNVTYPLTYFNARKGVQRTVLDEYHLAFTLHLSMMIHYANTVTPNQRNALVIYSDTFYLSQIRLGNMHPKDLAFCHDFDFLTSRGDAFPELRKGDLYFDIRLRTARTNKRILTNKEINVNRAKYYMAPIENDIEKMRFMSQNNMFIAWGFQASRS